MAEKYCPLRPRVAGTVDTICQEKLRVQEFSLGGKEIAFSHITSENPSVRLLHILTRVKNLGFHTLQNERSLKPEPTMRYIATQLYDQVMNVLHEECVMALSTFTQASMLI